MCGVEGVHVREGEGGTEGAGHQSGGSKRSKPDHGKVMPVQERGLAFVFVFQHFQIRFSPRKNVTDPYPTSQENQTNCGFDLILLLTFTALFFYRSLIRLR